VEYANRLTERGYQINLIIPRQTLETEIKQELSPQVAIYQSQTPLRSPPSLWNKLALAWSLSRVIPPSDIIFSTHTPTIPSAWLAARVWQRTKLFWLYQDYLEMFTERVIEQKLLQWGADRHDKILTVSEWSRQELAGFTGKEIVTVGEGLSHAELFQARPHLKHNRLRTILFLGDMRLRKGLQDFLAATELVYQRLPALELWIVSKDDCTIETSVPFRYIYRPSRQQLAELYAACDLFVSASWWESFGLPPLEAMACGAPVVLTDSRGVREFAQDGENCLLVPPRAPKALAEAIQCVLANPDLAGKLRQNGPLTAARFSWAKATDRFEKAIQ
jgi:glycosyltransferase involved in cell wall biosynthesis